MHLLSPLAPLSAPAAPQARGYAGPRKNPMMIGNGLWFVPCLDSVNFCTGTNQSPFPIPGIRRNRTNPVPCLPKLRGVLCSICVCVPFIINQTPAAGGGPCHDPRLAAFPGRWAIPLTGPGPQPLLVTYNLSSLALTPGEPTPCVCMYVSMVCGVYVGMCWVRGESTQVHR